MGHKLQRLPIKFGCLTTVLSHRVFVFTLYSDDVLTLTNQKIHYGEFDHSSGEFREFLERESLGKKIRVEKKSNQFLVRSNSLIAFLPTPKGVTVGTECQAHR